MPGTLTDGERPMASNVMTKCNGKSAPKLSPTKIDMRDAVSCRLSFEKCRGGFCIRCSCDESEKCDSLISLYEEICEGDCCCCCVRDGKQICNVNLGCCECKCDATDGGCCITCIGGNAKDCAMLQACCDCLDCCCQTGCCCYVCFGDKCFCFGNCNS